MRIAQWAAAAAAKMTVTTKTPISMNVNKKAPLSANYQYIRYILQAKGLTLNAQHLFVCLFVRCCIFALFYYCFHTLLLLPLLMLSSSQFLPPLLLLPIILYPSASAESSRVCSIESFSLSHTCLHTRNLPTSCAQFNIDLNI